MKISYYSSPSSFSCFFFWSHRGGDGVVGGFECYFTIDCLTCFGSIIRYNYGLYIQNTCFFCCEYIVSLLPFLLLLWDGVVGGFKCYFLLIASPVLGRLSDRKFFLCVCSLSFFSFLVYVCVFLFNRNFSFSTKIYI